MAGQRVIAQNPLSRVRLANRGIATPKPAWDLGTPFAGGGAVGLGNVGDVTFAPVGFKFVSFSPGGAGLNQTNGSPIVSVTQAAHGYSAGQAVNVSNATPGNGQVPNGQWLIASIVDANTWTFQVGSNATATGAFAGNAVQIQNLTPASILTMPGVTYQDADVGQIMSSASYPALLAAQGVLIKSFNLAPNAGSDAACLYTQSQVWNGAIYSARNSGKVAKRTSFMAAPGADLTPAAMTVNARGLLATASYLVQLSVDGGGATASARVFSSDTVVSAQVAYGTGGSANDLAHTAVEVAAGVILLLTCFAGPIYRTTNTGAAWAAISGNLSNPAVRMWMYGWVSGATVYMIGQAMALATSNDQGATWTVTTGLPNGGGNFNAPRRDNFNASGNIAVNPVTRRAYGALTDGSLVSWALDNPAAGFTIERAAGFFPSLINYRLFATAYGLHYMSDNVPGWWMAPWGALSAPWTILLNAATWSTYTDGCGYQAGWGLEAGDGFSGLDGTQQESKKHVAVVDGVKQFDRFTITDPMLPNGRRPFVRVL